MKNNKLLLIVALLTVSFWWLFSHYSTAHFDCKKIDVTNPSHVYYCMNGGQVDDSKFDIPMFPTITLAIILILIYNFRDDMRFNLSTLKRTSVFILLFLSLISYAIAIFIPVIVIEFQTPFQIKGPMNGFRCLFLPLISIFDYWIPGLNLLTLLDSKIDYLLPWLANVFFIFNLILVWSAPMTNLNVILSLIGMIMASTIFGSQGLLLSGGYVWLLSYFLNFVGCVLSLGNQPTTRRVKKHKIGK
jgi:hypothetical protein